ncbi:MAG: hypothetical protein ACK4TI_01245, partial [Nitrososphaerales archaeon]
TGLSLKKPYVVISPSEDKGTNALMLSLPTPITFRFGPNSYTLHLYEAEKIRSSVAVFYSKSIMLDVDGEKDISFFLKELKNGRGRKSWLYLKEIYEGRYT